MPRKRKSLGLSRAELVALYVDRTLTTKQIAGMVGCCPQTVANWLIDLGIPRRPACPTKGTCYASDEQRQRWSEQRKGSGNPRFGAVLSEETRRKIGAKSLGRTHSKDVRRKMSAAQCGERNHFFGRTHTEQAREVIGAKAKGRRPTYWKRIVYVRDSGEQFQFRSGWEVRVARALDRLGIAWEYESRTLDLGRHTYTPDFYLPTEALFYEVKGWFGPHAQQIVERARTMYPEIPIAVINKSAMLILERTAATAREATNIMADNGLTEGFYVVEQLGHRRLAGYVREVQVAGAGFLRIDVPGDEPDKFVATQMIAPSTIYALTPCSEGAARLVAKSSRPEPVHSWELPQIAHEASDAVEHICPVVIEDAGVPRQCGERADWDDEVSGFRCDAHEGRDEAAPK